MSSPIILVTGANRGIGFAIIQVTALRLPNATYILGCRSQPSGLAAISELQKLGVTATLDVVEIDVTNDASILAAKDTVEKKYHQLESTFLPPISNQKLDLMKIEHSFGKQRWDSSQTRRRHLALRPETFI
jgi:NAD(P)-dependent dehydrogenase (short-subunit alcohol dehydrogenase family)